VPQHRGGDEEDELAAGDGLLEGDCVVEVGLEQPEPLRRAGERPEESDLRLVPCRCRRRSRTTNCRTRKQNYSKSHMY
jgi:hypothetical protein